MDGRLDRRVYASMHACMHVYIYGCIDVRMHVCMYVSMYECAIMEQQLRGKH